MSQTHVAFTTFFFLVLTRISDLIITFRLSPTLEREANPIVTLFGGGATSLVAASVIVVISLSAGLLVFWRGRSLPSESPIRFTNFVSRWWGDVVGNRDPFANWMPGRSRWAHSVQGIRLVAVALSWALIFGSMISVYAWFALVANPSQGSHAFFARLSVGRFTVVPYMVAMFGFAFGMLLFFISEYSDTREAAVCKQPVGSP